MEGFSTSASFYWCEIVLLSDNTRTANDLTYNIQQRVLSYTADALEIVLGEIPNVDTTITMGFGPLRLKTITMKVPATSVIIIY